MRDRSGEIVKWFGSNTDIEDRKSADEAQRFLVEAGATLGSSLDYRTTLAALAKMAVPRVADWARVDIVEDGKLRTLAVEHVDERKIELALELGRRYPEAPDAAHGPPLVLRTGESELVTEITEERLSELAVDDLHLELVRELGFQSYMGVPLIARGRTLGVISFVAAESGRRYGPADLALAEELARRASTAIENAQLYREAEERAQAARVLETVADGVFLVDSEGIVRVWNRAAEAITKLVSTDVVGRRADEVLPGWQDLASRVPVAGRPGPAAATTLPLELDGEERWLSISGVGFDEGTVYAFRDITEERALEQIRQDLVSTVSHELRTPLAAIYGSALTLAREDLELEEAMHKKLLEVIVEESTRLADIVNDLLLASQLDAGRLEVHVEPCDAQALAASVLDAARTHLPEGTRVDFRSKPGGVPPRRRRRRPAPAGSDQPHRQRGQVLTRGRGRPCSPRSCRQVRALHDRRRRARHPAGRADPHLREVLPARSRHDGRHRGHGPGPVHLPRARPSRAWEDLGRAGRRARFRSSMERFRRPPSLFRVKSGVNGLRASALKASTGRR